MEQNKKIVLDTILKQQEKVLKKLYEEENMLKLALKDKQKQITMQEQVLEIIKKEK